MPAVREPQVRIPSAPPGSPDQRRWFTRALSAVKRRLSDKFPLAEASHNFSGQDGFDYAFRAGYARLWADEIQGIREVALHDPDCLVSIEYKPNEPRSYSLMPDCATTLLALKEVDLPNVGVTLDFAHVLYADEQPAF